MKILYISPTVPYKGIGGAGGAFFYDYLKGISKENEILLLAPETEKNMNAIKKKASWLNVNLVKTNSKENLNVYQKIIYSIKNPVSLSKKEINALANEIKKMNYLVDYDLVELQWSETLPLVDVIRKIDPCIPIISFEHDVFSQSIVRNVFYGSLSLNKIKNIIKLPFVHRAERVLLNKVDLVLTFSNKDVMYLKNMGVTTDVNSVVPNTKLSTEKRIAVKEPICLFVGAMNRSVNYEAMIWFLKDIWPMVIKEVPNAKLNIVGNSPPNKLYKYVDSTVNITGYVSDIDEFYHKSSIFVCPLLSGAGVKFKVLQALSYGLPVVTTPLGAEGIGESQVDRLFAGVTKNPKEFSENIIALLKDDNRQKTFSKYGQNWIKENFDFQKNTIKKVIDFYQSLLTKKGIK